MKKIWFFFVVSILLFAVSPVIANIAANLSEQQIFVNGKKVEMKAYNIEDNNYIRLRDIGKALNFSVEYDGKTDRVYINNDLPYTENDDTVIQSQADVYFQIFCDLFAQNTKEQGVKYLALDLTKVKFKQKEMIIKKFENYCNENELTLLLTTFDQLRENGYLEKIGNNVEYFSSGILISFNDEEVTDSLIVTKIENMRAFLHAEGATCKAEKKDGKWIIEFVEKWLS